MGQELITMSGKPSDARARDGALAAELAELNRDATALRNKFLNEFQHRRDSSARHFYKSMAISGTRFRVMTLCKFAPRDRTKPECDQDDFEATIDLRQYLGEYLHSFCSELPEFVNGFIDNLSRIRHDMTWIDGQAGEFLPLLDSEYAPWAQIACDGKPAGTNWNAPGWLDRWPETLLPDVALSAARGGRLDAERTAKVLKVIGNRIKERLNSDQKRALDGLRVRFAHKKEAARQDTSAAGAKAAVKTKGESHEPIEVTRADMEVAKDSAGIVEPKTKRGPKARIEFHRAVATVVLSFAPKWKDHLEQIARKLDRQKKMTPASSAWAKRERPALSWTRAFEYYPDVVVKVLDYSLEKAAKDITEKPSETPGKLR
jgi:hypothetical protein